MGLLKKMLDLLYPPRCAMCHRLLEADDSAICPACENAIHRTACGGARTGTQFSVCVSPLYYQDAVRDAVIHLKFHGMTSGIPLFGRWMADCVQEHLADCYDLITWTPVSRKRLRRRGYDQARLLAKAATQCLKKPLVSTLVKRVHTPAQSGISDPAQRAENVRDVYTVVPDTVKGKRVLLIDDVITTGATLESAAAALRKAGAVSVVCCTLACTSFSEEKQEAAV